MAGRGQPLRSHALPSQRSGCLQGDGPGHGHSVRVLRRRRPYDSLACRSSRTGRASLQDLLTFGAAVPIGSARTGSVHHACQWPIQDPELDIDIL